MAFCYWLTNISRYLVRGALFVLLESGSPIAVAVVTKEGNGICELQNLDVAQDWQRKSFGRMVEDIACRYGASHHTMLVGTGDSAATLPSYICCGFPKATTLKTNLPTTILLWRTGVHIVDKVILKLFLWVMETPRMRFLASSFARRP